MSDKQRLYDQAFHADRDARTRATARQVLQILHEINPVHSICDVGCGVGTWLAAGRELGAGALLGFEGPWGETNVLAIEPEAIRFQDLESPVSATCRFDLVISLEVAEHLSPARAPGFVADLAALGDLVLFSAAIPQQGGTGHINEQWPSWWAEQFAAQGYAAFDPIRPLIWTDQSVAWWYRQNMLVYARQGSAAQGALRAAGHGAPAMLDIVHPEQFAHAASAGPLRAAARMARRWKVAPEAR